MHRMIEINLLPGAQRKRARSLGGISTGAIRSTLAARFSDRYLMVAIAAVIIAVFAIGTMYATQFEHEEEVRAHYADVVRDSTRFATVLAARASAESERDSVYQQLAIIKSIDDTRYTWPHVLEEINTSLPSYTWLTSVTQTSVVTTTAAPGADSTNKGKSAAAKKGAHKTASADIKARRAHADSLYNGEMGSTKFRIVGQTVDIQALTLFMKNLEASPFIKNVQLARSDLVITDAKEVTEFQLDAETEVPPQVAINTVPLSVVVH